MPEFTIATSSLINATSGKSVDVDSDNWMMALGKAMPLLGVDPSAMFRWVITPGAAGVVYVEDPGSGARFVLKPKVTVKMVVARGASASLPEENEELPRRRDEDEDEVPTLLAPPPMLTMPLTSSLAPPPAPPPSNIRRKTTEIESVGERLFDLSTEIAGASPADAAQRTLAVLQEFIPSEASSIARGSIADFHLTIIAATGPVAESVQGRVVPFGEGYVGLCFDARIPIQVNDIEGDERHHVEIDTSTGFATRAVMCVPVMRGDEIFGVIQILNPENPFITEDIEVAAQIAHTLAESLASSTDADVL